jgi:hypothetical protein
VIRVKIQKVNRRLYYSVQDDKGGEIEIEELRALATTWRKLLIGTQVVHSNVIHERVFSKASREMSEC